jgi:glutamate-ammonia-ligase adenylyltransferase
VTAAIEAGAYGLPWRAELVDEVLAMRQRLEAIRSTRDLKRGPGGLADVEFLVQMLQLAHGRDLPALRTTNTWQALAALRDGGVIDPDEHAALRGGYDFLMRVQNRLRIVHNRSLDAFPEAPAEIEKLARRLGYDGGPRFSAELERHTTQVREVFLRVAGRQRDHSAGGEN